MINSLLIAPTHMKTHLRFALLLLVSFLCSLYWSCYWSWLGPFLSCASEGMRMRLLVPSHWMQFRIHEHQVCASSSTTSFGPSPVPYDGWHTLFDFFHCSIADVKPPPWPSFPARLFPTLGMCFLVHMWFHNLILRCRGFCWDVWKLCTCKTSNVTPFLLGKFMSDELAPVKPPEKPSSRKIRNTPLVGGKSLAMFLSLLEVWL